MTGASECLSITILIKFAWISILTYLLMIGMNLIVPRGNLSLSSIMMGDTGLIILVI